MEITLQKQRDIVFYDQSNSYLNINFNNMNFLYYPFRFKRRNEENKKRKKKQLSDMLLFSIFRVVSKDNQLICLKLEEKKSNFKFLILNCFQFQISK